MPSENWHPPMALPERQVNADGSLRLPSEVDTPPAPLFPDIPEATVEGDKIKLSAPFDFNAWKSTLPDYERRTIKTGGTAALAAALNDDRAQWSKVQQLASTTGEDAGAFFKGVLDDPDLYGFLDRRGLSEKLFPTPDAGSVLWDAAKATGSAAVALVADIPDYAAGTMAGNLKAGAALEATKTNYKTLLTMVGGWIGNAKAKQDRTQIGLEAWRSDDTDEKLLTLSKSQTEASRQRKLKQLEVATQFDEYLTNRAAILGVSKEHLNDSAQGGAILLDPSNLLEAGAGMIMSRTAGAAARTVPLAVAHEALAMQPGLVRGIFKEIAENAAEQTSLAARIADTGSDVGFADDLAAATARGIDLQEKLAGIQRGTQAALAASEAATPGLARAATGSAVSATGTATRATAEFADSVIERIGEKIPMAVRPVALAAGGYVAGSVLGGDQRSGLAGALLGGVPGAVKLATRLGRDGQIIGDIIKAGATGASALPGSVARSEASAVTRQVAGLLDRASILDRLVPGVSVTNTAGRMAKGAIASGAVGGAFGAVLAGPDDPSTGFWSGVGSAAPFGAVAGAFNSFVPFEQAEQAARYLEARRQLVESRFRPNNDKATTPNWENWQKLSRGHQLALASTLHAYPDIDVRVIDEPGRPSSHTLEGGHGVVTVNVADKTPLKALFAHELKHDIDARGDGRTIKRIYLGDPAENRPGHYTALDASGAPVTSATVNPDGSPRYETTDDFKDAKIDYWRKWALGEGHRTTGEIAAMPREQQIKESDVAFTDEYMAREMAAEEGAQSLLKGDLDRAVLPTVAGVLNSTLTNWQWSRNLLAKLGMPVGPEALVGSGLFKDLQSLPEVQALLGKHLDNVARTGRLSDYSEKDQGTQITAQKIRVNPDLLRIFDASGDLNVNPATGLPYGTSVDATTGRLRIDDDSRVFNTKGQAAKIQKELVKEVLTRLPKHTKPADPDVVQPRKTADGKTLVAGRYLPEAVIDEIEALGKFNPHQLRQLREINAALKDTAGQGFTFFYQPAERRLIGGRRDRGVRALEGHWRTEIPYAISISGQGNILIKTFSPDTFIENVDRGWNRGKGREMWNSREELVKDAMLYLDNLSHNKPGEEGLGVAKKNWLNSAFGWRGKDRELVNPLYSLLADDTRTPVIARRLDRVNKATPNTAEQTVPWTWKSNERAKQNLRPATQDLPAATKDRDLADQTIDTFIRVLGGDGAWPRNGITITGEDANKLQAALEKEVFTWPDSVLKEKAESLARTGVAAQDWAESATRFRPASSDLDSVGGGGLPTLGDEEVRLIHYGQPGLRVTDPKKLGKGNATPGDMKGDYKTYFFVEGSKTGADLNITQGRSVYGAKVPGQKIYDVEAGDPIGWLDEINRWKADGKVKSAGFDGLKVRSFGRDVVALFKPTKVTDLGQSPAKGMKKAGIPPGSDVRFRPADDAGTPDFIDDPEKLVESRHSGGPRVVPEVKLGGITDKEFLAKAVGDTAENLRKKLTKREGTGVSAHKVVRFEDAQGRPIFIGADEKHGGKNFDDWADETETWLNDSEVSKFRKWYSELHSEFVKEFGADHAGRMMMAWLASQQNESPGGGLRNVFRVEDRLDGLGLGKKGGLADGKIEGILKGEVPEKGFGPKLADFVDAGFQRKTRTFMGEDPRGGAPFVADVHTGRDAGLVDQQTITRLVDAASTGKLLVNGEPLVAKVTRWKKVKQGDEVVRQPVSAIFEKPDGSRIRLETETTGSPSGTQYEGVSEWGNNLTKHLNKLDWKGGKWSPEEVQAVGWMRILRQYGLPESDIASTLAMNTSRMYAEVNYSSGSVLPKEFPDLGALPIEKQRAITAEVLSNAIPALVGKLGGSLRVRSVSSGDGLFGGQQAPSIAVEVFGSPESTEMLAASLAYASEQAATMSVVFGKGGQNSNVIRIKKAGGGKFTPEEAQSLIEAMKVGGASLHQFPSGQEMVISDARPDYTPKSFTKAKIGKIAPLIDAWADTSGVGLAVDVEPAIVTSYGNDWKSESQSEGQGYLEVLNARGIGEKLRAVVDFRGVYKDLVRKAFEQHAPEALGQGPAVAPATE